MKNKNNILIVLMIIMIIFTIIFIFLNKDKKYSDEIYTLYNYISNEDINYCNGLLFYNNDKTLYDNINNDDKLCLAFIKTTDKKGSKEEIKKDKKNNICTYKKKYKFAVDNYDSDKCTIDIYSLDTIKNTYNNIFNNEIKDTNMFNLDGKTICYIDEDKVYCGLNESFTITIANTQYIYRNIYKTEEKGTYINIYDYFIRINNDECFHSFLGNKNEECTNNLIDDINYKFLKKYGSKYKHIFKKSNDNNYYWYSSELIK